MNWHNWHICHKLEVYKVFQEKWYKSRRVWGSILSGIVLSLTLLFPDKFELIQATALAIATTLGISSFTMPKN